MVARSREAAAQFRQLDQREVDEIVWRMARAGLLAAYDLARMAVDETGIGLYEDKVLKHYTATEFLYDYLRGKKTVGVIKEDPARALKWVAEPIGSVLAIMPITNPTSTALFKTIVAAKTRNAMIVRPSSKALRCSQEAVRVVVEAAEAAGMPPGAIQCMDAPTHADTQYLFGHDGVDFIWTTGGQRIVQAANASGKPTIGVGPGNAPVYLHESADIPMAVLDVLMSKTFDASTICPAEQTMVVDRAIDSEVRAELERMGARFLDRDEAERLAEICFDSVTGHLNFFAIGQPPQMLAGAAGIDIDPATKVLVVPVERFDLAEIFLHEKLFPVLAYLVADDVEHALTLCEGVTEIAGLGHTSAVYARDERVVDAFSQRIRTGRILVNCPTAIGALGGMYTDLPPTYSLGCGTWGGSNTTANVNVDELLNIKQVSYRKHPPMWFRAPVDVYFNEHSIDNLRQVPAERVAVITSPGNVARGNVERVTDRLAAGAIDIYSDIGVEPTNEDAEKLVAFLQRFEPQAIVALGGGSVLDIAKAARIGYEHPEADWTDLALPFLDVRKRIAEYPQRRPDALRLVAIPTTSGTGSEVSPAAVVTHAQTGRKTTLVDYTLVPEIAIVDPTLAVSMPAGVTRDSGVDAVTHAIESLVSSFASPYTHALSLRALHDLFTTLPAVYADGENLELRSRVHNAATMAGLAFSNAFVGVGHALAHALGSTFPVSHGAACGVFLPHVIRYNGAAVPGKNLPSPTQTRWTAPETYAQAARALGLGSSREKPEEGLARFEETTIELLEAVEQPRSLAALGITEEQFREQRSAMAQLAFEDPSIRTNPRAPMIAELEELLDQAWAGW
ncbi:MAG: bifunctional acetaldehyde-CoA/alcohol dehydrogenase [Thermoleophilia bacterium]|nr:bifunctional acetaldehyde-CoA/alcohol dehydrogenase [Thermoleophilia bacterium]